MKTPIYLSIFIGLFFCIGCTAPPADPDAGLKSSSPTELVKSAIQETVEFKFCISEEAGMDSLKESAERLQKIIEALPESVSGSALEQSKKDQLGQAIESLKTSCDGLASSIEGQASIGELSKANKKIRSELISISKKSL